MGLNEEGILGVCLMGQGRRAVVFTYLGSVFKRVMSNTVQQGQSHVFVNGGICR